MKNLLIIHQSAELYGSDKTLLVFLQNIDKTLFCPIVILPNSGPLQIELEKINIEVVILPVLKLYRKMFVPKNAILFIKEYFKGIKALDSLNKKYNFEIVYSNTLAVLLGFFYAKKRKIKHVWHVHEIIESPVIFKKAFQYLLSSKTNTLLIYNSKATQAFWNINGNNKVVWNGVDTIKNFITEEKRNEIRSKFFQSNHELVIGLVGRISRWKGQIVLLEAFKKLQETESNIKLVFIGSPPPNQNEFLIELNDKIVAFNIADKVSIIPFQQNIEHFQQALDIVVVPSTEPEPFGLVAIEAMMAKKPVVAANHGGLTEIVVDHETGFLITPNNEAELVEALSKLINNQNLRTNFGSNGYSRALEYFTTDKYVENLQKAIINT